MDRIKFIHHKGTEILHLDFAGCKADEVPPLIEYAKPLIASRPHASVRVLTDVTNARFDDTVNQRLKEFTAHNKPYIKASAIVGVTGIKKILFEAIILFSQRKIHAYDSAEAAKDWLISQ